MVKGGARLFLATSALALAAAAQANETVTYSYDALGRLIATTSSGSVNSGLTTQLGYDAAGNRSTYTVSVGGAGGGGGGTGGGGTGGTGGGAITVGSGSFEVPEVGSGYAYSPAVTGASFGPNAGIAGNGSAFGFAAAPDGDQTAFLQSGGALSLNVSGLAGGTAYVARFYLAQRPGFGANPVTVGYNGAILGTFTPASTAFVQFEAGFTASGTGGTLTFTGASSTADIASGLDMVSVAAGSPTTTPLPPPTPANQPPVAVNDSGGTNKCTAASFAVLSNDYDPDGNTPLTLVGVTYGGARGEASVMGNSVYFAPSGTTGPANVTYTIQDTLGATASAILSITIANGSCGSSVDTPLAQAAAPPPAADAAAGTVPEGGP